MSLISEEILFKVKFAEMDFLAFSDAIFSTTVLATQAADADVTAQDQLPIGDSAAVNEIALLWVGTNPESGSRLFHMPFCVATGGLLLGFDKKQTVYDVEWTVLTNPAGTAGERMAKLYDITAVASS